MTKILRLEKVLEITGMSKATIYRRIRNAEFPEAVRLGGAGTRAVGWRAEDVEDWLSGLANAGCGEDEGIGTRSR